jgi:hypothetical protein
VSFPFVSQLNVRNAFCFAPQLDASIRRAKSLVQVVQSARWCIARTPALELSSIPCHILFHHSFEYLYEISVLSLSFTILAQVSFSSSPSANRPRSSVSPAHSVTRSPASAAAAAAAPHQRAFASNDDFSFRVLVPSQAASHFNFLSQVLLSRAFGLVTSHVHSQFVSKKSQFDD